MCRLAPRLASAAVPSFAPYIVCALAPHRVRPLSCTALILLVFASTGCATRAGRPDAEVARTVEREDRRFAQRSAVALASDLDLGPLDLASARVWMEALGLVVAPNTQESDTAAAAPIGAAEGWHYQPPAAWMVQPLQFATAEQLKWSEFGRFHDSGPKGLIGIDTSSDSGDDGKSGGGKPKILVNLLRMRIKDRPVSFSGSVKGLKGVQVKATIKM